MLHTVNILSSMKIFQFFFIYSENTQLSKNVEMFFVLKSFAKWYGFWVSQNGILTKYMVRLMRSNAFFMQTVVI